jgi:hypothetical protein
VAGKGKIHVVFGPIAGRALAKVYVPVSTVTVVPSVDHAKMERIHRQSGSNTFHSVLNSIRCGQGSGEVLYEEREAFAVMLEADGRAVWLIASRKCCEPHSKCGCSFFPRLLGQARITGQLTQSLNGLYISLIVVPISRQSAVRLIP